MRARVVLVATAAVTVGIDIASKMWATTALVDHSRRIGPITLRLVHNHGVVFGIGAYLPPVAILVLTASMAAGVAIAAWGGVVRPPFAAGLIVGGAVANVADRLTAGSVIDFISIGRRPIFNLADTFLIAGGILLLLRDAPEKGKPSVRM
ncbi:MAG: signal peptidase II [Ilumatobacteraceae bacterium]